MNRVRQFNILILFVILISVSCSTGNNNPVLQPNPSASASDNQQNGSAVSKSEVKEFIFRVGPIDLPEGIDATIMLERPLTMRFQIGEPIWITAMEPSIVSSQGEKLSGDLLHRAVIFNLHEENPLCTESKKGNPILVATSTLTKIEFPQGFAYPILPTDPIEVAASLKNQNTTGYTGVYFELKLTGKPMNDFVKMKDLKPILLTTDPCDLRPVRVGAEEIVERAATYKIEKPGSLLMASGALQDYGVTIALTKKADAIPFWRTQAKLDEKNRVFALTDNPFTDPAGIPFKASDTITFSSGFNNPTTKWSNTSTAEAVVYMAEEEK